MESKRPRFKLSRPGRAHRRFFWLLLIPLLLACNLLNRDEEPTAVPATSSATAVTPADGTPTTAPAADTPTATVAPTGPLPAALYFIGSNGQIMRLETDGTTLRQITNEPQAVDHLDVSPVDSSLIYVSGNTLIQTDAYGDNRLVKVTGGPIDPEAGITTIISHPRFSPDGEQIAFGYNGVNLIPSGPATEYVASQPSDPMPDFSDPNNPPDIPEGPIRFFYEGQWSPDGQRLALSFGYFPEGGSMAIKEVNSGQLIDLTNSDYITCCHWAWGTQSNRAFLASDLMVYGAPGLVSIDAATGQATTLIKGVPAGDQITSDDPARLFLAPIQLADGRLRFFMDLATSPDQFGGSGFFTMYQSEANGTNLVSLRQDSHRAGDITWYRDGRGAALVDASNSQSWPFSGPLLWLPADGGPVVGLAAAGRAPRWAGLSASGTPPPVAATVAAPPTPVPTQVIVPTVAITPVRVDPTPAEVETLKQQFLALSGISPSPSGIAGAVVIPFDSFNGQRFYLAHTVGMRGFNPTAQNHALAIYRFADAWQELARYTYSDNGDANSPPPPDFLNEGSVNQVFVEPAGDWFTVDGGIGAHGGIYQAIRFNGSDNLQSTVSGGNATPGAGFTADLNGDGWQEIILDASDYYIFSYAAGVRLVDYLIHYWDGSQMVAVALTPLPAGAPGADATNQAIQFAAADLWYEAQVAAGQAALADPGDPVVVWNKAYIDLVVDGRVPSGVCTVLENVFLGDYVSAEIVLDRTDLAPAELFSPAGVLAGCQSGPGYETTMAGHIVDFAGRALTVLPDYPSAYFLRGWATYLNNPADPAAVSDIQQAVGLDPAIELYAAALSFLTGP